ncbi:MAG: hypothetical protein N3G80_00740 [Candidatus Micrarchaeota archaeon]|nr:hypothetical protein [Candidatus Micrarchaeota archaeon]
MKVIGAFKKRYIAFRLSVDGQPPTEEAAKNLIYRHFLSFFGELGFSGLGFKIINYQNGRGIIRCHKDRHAEAIFCMACLTEWSSKKARMEPIVSSGTIFKAGQKAEEERGKS